MIGTRMLVLHISCILLGVTTGTRCVAAAPAAAFDTYLKAWAEQDEFSGVVLVAQDGRILHHQAYGRADVEGDIPLTVDSRFRIGSLTKAFTAMAVLQLEQKGLVARSARLSEILPDYPHGDVITLEMLLNHRSGLVDHTTLPDFQTRRRTTVVPVTETIDTFRHLPLRFTPGSKFEYSNSNYVLLGYLIEKVTGRSYAEVVQQQILTPLGMAHSGFEFEGVAEPKLVRGYRRQDGEIVPALDRVMQNAGGSGALYATAADLYAWDRALYTPQLLDAVRLQQINHPSNGDYVYGWAVTEQCGRRALAHMGDTEGFKAFIYRFVEDNACVIVLSNFEHCPIDRIAEDLAAILFGRPYELPKKALADADVAQRYPGYVGRYQLKPGFVFTITLENDRLYCQATNQPRFQLHPEEEDRFFIREFNAAISFECQANGTAIRLIVHQGGKNVPAERL